MIESTELEYAFEVEPFDTMAARLPGKLPETVLVLQVMIYTWRIAEYTDPMSYGRYWCYDDQHEALRSIIVFLVDDKPEPSNWIKAVDFGEGVGPHDRHYVIRVRKARVVDGERVIYRVNEEDGTEVILSSSPPPAVVPSQGRRGGEYAGKESDQ